MKANMKCVICETEMEVVTFTSVHMFGSSEIITMSCPKKYCRQNELENEMYSRSRLWPTLRNTRRFHNQCVI